jgi:hypothetical protein
MIIAVAVILVLPGHVGGEDRGEAADRGHGLSGGRWA